MNQVQTPAPKEAVSLARYSVLLQRIRQAIGRGKERAADAVERELVRTKWETGKLIHEHILLNQVRAAYDQQVLERLSTDLGMSARELRYMVEFARAYPIWPGPAKLGWAQYRDLLAVNDPEKRLAISKEAVRKKWSHSELRREIQKLKAAKQITVSKKPAPEKLAAKKGELHTYAVVLAKLGPWQGKPVVDLGFSNYFRPAGNFPFKKNEIIRILDNGKLKRIQDATAGMLFTYKVYVDEITDGDTLWVLIDLGFGFTTKQQLRLRGLDAPEIATRDGQRAKKFLERQLVGRLGSDPSHVLITSTKSDKYDRYLADIWMGELFLNQKLIDKGLALKVKA